ncbi:MAG: putative Ig domain-containing protein, partial [Proteobacteria bacterium]|nr:putative Ig domain-containing protein [Pseudomonadota bacterium]
MKVLRIGGITVVCAATLAACGGGGGSGGESHAQYQITLRADKTILPLNASGQAAGIGAYAPFTTTLYVSATEAGRPIPGADDKTFACDVKGGLNSGSLYYLDGNKEHEDDKGNALSYRSITLGANSGGNSFHFHAGTAAGDATITCSVTDPRDKKQYSASVNIKVGQATANPGRVEGFTQALGYLGTTKNLKGLPTAVAIQARVWDDANQPVPNPSADNLQVRIRPMGDAANGARLLEGGKPGNGVIQLRTVGGVGQFALASGANSGPIVLEFTTDRADNNVSNGIQDPVISLMQVYAVDEVASTPLALTAANFGTLTNGVEFAYALEATGGVPPYTWVVSGLPAGLTADSSGIISGTPKSPAGTYRAKARVTDKNGQYQDADMTLTLVGDHREVKPEDFVINGCPAAQNINVPCPISAAT